MRHENPSFRKFHFNKNAMKIFAAGTFLLTVLAMSALHATVLLKKVHAGPLMKYDIKSAIVTYDRLDTQKGVTTHTKEIVYFDDYGVTECHEVYDLSGGTPKLASGRYGKGEAEYRYNMTSKVAAWDSYDSTGVFPRFDLKEGSASLKKDENYKEIAGDTIAGKFCDGVSCSPFADADVRCYGYKHILMKLYSDYPTYGNKMVLVATDIQENVPIPPEKFALPEGVVMEKMGK